MFMFMEKFSHQIKRRWCVSSLLGRQDMPQVHELKYVSCSKLLGEEAILLISDLCGSQR